MTLDSALFRKWLYLDLGRIVMRARSLEKWTVGRSAELYGVDNWGGGYFRAMPGGELAITQ